MERTFEVEGIILESHPEYVIKLVADGCKKIYKEECEVFDKQGNSVCGVCHSISHACRRIKSLARHSQEVRYVQ